MHDQTLATVMMATNLIMMVAAQLAPLSLDGHAPEHHPPLLILAPKYVAMGLSTFKHVMTGIMPARTGIELIINSLNFVDALRIAQSKMAILAKEGPRNLLTHATKCAEMEGL